MNQPMAESHLNTEKKLHIPFKHGSNIHPDKEQPSRFKWMNFNFLPRCEFFGRLQCSMRCLYNVLSSSPAKLLVHTIALYDTQLLLMMGSTLALAVINGASSRVIAGPDNDDTAYIAMEHTVPAGDSTTRRRSTPTTTT